MQPMRGMPVDIRAVAALLLLLLSKSLCHGQGEGTRLSSRLAIGVKVSALGAGLEAATPFSRRANLRAGFNAFGLDLRFHRDGIPYSGQLSFHSVEAHYDWFPFYGSFHISPGVLVYNGNRLNARVSIPASQSFTLNHTPYVSDAAKPVNGTGSLNFPRAGPMISIGWGNLLPRNGTHFTIPFEVGAVYTGPPLARLNLAGAVCDSSGTNCRNFAADPILQSNVQGENNRLNRLLSPFRFYPLISVGFGFSF